jgi:hypothetical protein
MRVVSLVVALIAGLSAAPAQSGNQKSAPPPAPTYTKVHALKPREGVFAYARISPDGKKLVYASQLPARPGTPRGWTETLVDLATQDVLFSETGIDAYWSLDGTRIIYSGNDGVTVRNVATGEKVVSAAASGLGDYYSWAARDGKDLILTIESNYYNLDHDKAVLPHTKVSKCDAIGGTGDRPLISKDGRRITTFVKGNVVVRGLDNCNDIFDTGIQGAKADFSWDGRYIAFHALKSKGDGYEIKIVDVQQRTIRTLPGLTGSALFPSWTQDGRLCFRYDGADYRGFMMASGVLDVQSEPLPAPTQLPAQRSWQDIFPNTLAPKSQLSVVLIWAPWSVHSRDAFEQLTQARDYLASRIPGLTVMNAPDPGSSEADITQQLADFHVTIPRINISGHGLLLTEARNQMPTTLLFKDGVLVDRRLGAQSFDRLKEWIGGVAGLK